ncbi:MAG: hypothetical protein LAO20_01480 [Acidobacteriia bacterium]|nr:hypothetical protein [Terriglobia bacterium]
MKVLRRLGFLVLASGMALAQSNPPSNSTVADELKALREAIAAQQKQIAQQQQDMAQQKQQIESLKQALDEKTSGTPHVADAALRTPTTTEPVNVATAVQGDKEAVKESPLSFRIGGAEFTPGGFIDFENIFRTTNAGAGTATSFGSIPFSNTIQGHLTEFRSTGQYSRLSLKVGAKYGENRVVGYVEGDFNGNDAANVFVSSNPHTARVRLFWVDMRRGKWEFVGGQTWGLQTPNRVGLSPNPGDVFVPIGEDAQTHVGLPYTRAGEFRAIYHVNDNFQWGVALQNPDQFVGAGEVIFPFAFNAALGPQFDAANQTTVADAFPDIHTKFAWDKDVDGKHQHFEAGGIITSAKITNVPIGGTTFAHHSAIGATGHAAFNFELVKGFRVMANGIWGSGAGRYMIGFGPQAVVVPIATGPGTFDTDVSMVHSGGTIVGSELQIGKNTQLGAYYGGFYFGRNSFADVTSPLVVKPIIGFGGINSPNSANRAIQEASFDWTQTFWKNPQYGAVLLVTQTSYVTRAPWFVAAGAPKNAHLMMGFVSLKYVIP